LIDPVYNCKSHAKVICLMKTTILLKFKLCVYGSILIKEFDLMQTIFTKTFNNIQFCVFRFFEWKCKFDLDPFR